MNTRAVGAAYEDLACRQLEKAGMEILARNYRVRAGEIDIIARDKEAKPYVWIDRFNSSTDPDALYGHRSFAIGNHFICITVAYRDRILGTIIRSDCSEVSECFLPKIIIIRLSAFHNIKVKIRIAAINKYIELLEKNTLRYIHTCFGYLRESSPPIFY